MTTSIQPTPTLEHIERTLSQDIMRHGYRQAVRDYCTPLYQAWLASLDAGADHTGNATRIRLAAGMHASLAIRDALLVSTITTISDLDTMVMVAAQPHDPDTKSLVSRVLTHAFEDSDVVHDQVRVRTALTILDAMRQDLTAADSQTADDYACQPLAASSYIEWWSGDASSATIHAQQALSSDPDTSLAVIVLTALNHGIQPASAQPQDA